MPKINSNLEATKGFIPIDDGFAQAKVCEAPKVDTPEGKPWNMTLTWELYGNSGNENTASDPKWNGKKVSYDRVMIGGKNEHGEPYSLVKLLNYIGACGVSYTCLNCNDVQSDAPVRKGVDFFCPSCDSVLTAIDWNSDDFTNKSAMINVRKKRQETKDPSDPNGKRYIPAVDEDGQPKWQNDVKSIKRLE